MSPDGDKRWYVGGCFGVTEWCDEASRHAAVCLCDHHHGAQANGDTEGSARVEMKGKGGKQTRKHKVRSYFMSQFRNGARTKPKVVLT